MRSINEKAIQNCKVFSISKQFTTSAICPFEKKFYKRITLKGIF